MGRHRRRALAPRGVGREAVVFEELGLQGDDVILPALEQAPVDVAERLAQVLYGVVGQALDLDVHVGERTRTRGLAVRTLDHERVVERR